MTEKEERQLRTGGTSKRHIETEILIRVRAVMFKLSDNILLCLQTCSLWTNNRCWAGLKNSTHCIMYKAPARKHKEQEGDSIKVGPAFTMCPHLLPVRLCCCICMGLMLQQDTELEMKGELHTARVFISSELSATWPHTSWPHRLIVHKTPEWTSCRPTCFQPVGR